MNLYSFTNQELLDASAMLTKANYYEPGGTDPEVRLFREYGVTTYDLERIILQRMALSGPAED